MRFEFADKMRLPTLIKIISLFTIQWKQIIHLLKNQSNGNRKASIEEYGLRTPIVVGSDYTIIDGYRRVSVYKELGYDFIPAFDVKEATPLTEGITRNLTRVKTTEDLLSEMREVFKKYLKKQGKTTPKPKAWERLCVGPS